MNTKEYYREYRRKNHARLLEYSRAYNSNPQNRKRKLKQNSSRYWSDPEYRERKKAASIEYQHRKKTERTENHG